MPFGPLLLNKIKYMKAVRTAKHIQIDRRYTNVNQHYVELTRRPHNESITVTTQVHNESFKSSFTDHRTTSADS